MGDAMTKTQRQKQLLMRIKLAADMALDSAALRPDRVQAILRMALELATDMTLNDDKRKVLGRVLGDCLLDDTDTVEFVERNELYINGTFDVRELAKRITW